MASEQAPAVELSKYTKRVVLKTLLGRSDGGVGLIGQRVVIGGWVKSSREIRIQSATPPPVPAHVVSPKDVTCSEVLQSRIPLLRSIMKVFGAGEYRVREKINVVFQTMPQPSVSILQVSDGSCVASLQVHSMIRYDFYLFVEMSLFRISDIICLVGL